MNVSNGKRLKKPRFRLLVATPADRQRSNFQGAAKHIAASDQAPVKAGSRPGVTGNSSALNLDRQPNDILVAVGSNFDNSQQVAAFLALPPKFITRPAPKVRESGRERLSKRRFVHVSEHQDVA